MYIPSNKQLTEKLSAGTTKNFGIIGLVGSISVLSLSIFLGDGTAIWYSAASPLSPARPPPIFGSYIYD